MRDAKSTEEKNPLVTPLITISILANLLAFLIY